MVNTNTSTLQVHLNTSFSPVYVCHNYNFSHSMIQYFGHTVHHYFKEFRLPALHQPLCIEVLGNNTANTLSTKYVQNKVSKSSPIKQSVVFWLHPKHTHFHGRVQMPLVTGHGCTIPLITADTSDQRQQSQWKQARWVQKAPTTHIPAVSKPSLDPNIATKSEWAIAKHEGADKRKSL